MKQPLPPRPAPRRAQQTLTGLAKPDAAQLALDSSRLASETAAQARYVAESALRLSRETAENQRIDRATNASEHKELERTVKRGNRNTVLTQVVASLGLVLVALVGGYFALAQTRMQARDQASEKARQVALDSSLDKAAEKGATLAIEAWRRENEQDVRRMIREAVDSKTPDGMKERKR